jgi:hypothetical protein
MSGNSPLASNPFGGAGWKSSDVTLPSVPTVITGVAANITDLAADFIDSQVVNGGTLPVTERGIVFSDTNPIPDIDDRKVISPTTGLGGYNLPLTGLDSVTNYYVRAYAINELGVGYGEVATFATVDKYVADEGDGYWTWTPSGSTAVLGRSQASLPYSSANLPLADLNLESGSEYTLFYAEKANTNGDTKIVLQWFDEEVKEQEVITPGTPFTFTYDTAKTDWAIRLFVTGLNPEDDPITATFSDMYLAKESEFSGYVPFVANGTTEVKIINNWLIDKKRSDIITSIFNKLSGQSWYPFDIKTEGLGWFEIGDRFTIQDGDGNTYPVVMWNSSLTIDGGINERLFTDTPDLTETDYTKAGRLGGLWKRTQIEVDKNKMEIQSLVEAVYNADGILNTKFTEIFQDVNEIRTTVQGSGGVNLIKNSVMYAFDNEQLPENWTLSGDGTHVIQSSPESLTAGAVAGNTFTLSNKSAVQRVSVRKDFDFVTEEKKTYYAISARVKKNIVGDAWIKLSNRNQTLTIPLPDQEGYFWDSVSFESILPLDDYFDIEVYSDADASLQVTDLIMAPGKTKREWSQANGEVMNATGSFTVDGLTMRSPQFPNDYTKLDHMGLEVHSKDSSGGRVFGFNKDETNVSKLKVDNRISMSPMKIVPINYDSYKGFAFTLSEED